MPGLIASNSNAGQHDLPESLTTFAKTISERAHCFAFPGSEDADSVEISRLALEETKKLFDLGLKQEQTSLPHLSSLLSSLSSSYPSTRSQLKRKRPDQPQFYPTPLSELFVEGMDEEQVWEQMELRLDLVGGVVGEVLKECGAEDEDEEVGEQSAEGSQDSEEDVEGLGETDGLDDEDDEEGGEFVYDSEDISDDEEDDEEEDDEEEDANPQPPRPFRTEPYFQPLKDDSQGESEVEEDQEDADTSYLSTLGAGGKKKGKKGNLEDGVKAGDLSIVGLESRGLKKGKGTKSKASSGPITPVDDPFFSLNDFLDAVDRGEKEMARSIKRAKKSDVGVEAGDEDDEDGDGDEEEVDYFAELGVGEDGEGMEVEGEGDVTGGKTDVSYADFFDPPIRPVSKPTPTVNTTTPAAPTAALPPANSVTSSRRSVRFSESVKVKDIESLPKDVIVADQFNAPTFMELAKRAEKFLKEKERGKLRQKGGEVDDSEDEDDGSGDEGERDEVGDEDGVEFEEDDEGGDEEDGSEDASEEEEGEDDEGAQTMKRFNDDLFADADDLIQESAKANQSTHSRRLSEIAKQISQFESENVEKKDWTLSGEARSRDRPVNSLLEEDLEFENVNRVGPTGMGTEEREGGLEGLIKRRILENTFDDVVRRRPIEPNAFLPSRLLELADSRSERSLADIYADEYSRAGGEQVVQAVDQKLEAEHDKLKEMFEDICGKLDALSNARFTPKPPKGTIQTVSNLSSISLESALPTSASTSTLLTPEEVYRPTGPVDKGSKSELTPEEKQAERNKRRKSKQKLNKQIEKFTNAGGAGPVKKRLGSSGGGGGGRGGKEEDKKKAIAGLVGKKGVTVIGKEAKGKASEKGKGKDKPEAANFIKL